MQVDNRISAPMLYLNIYIYIHIYIYLRIIYTHVCIGVFGIYISRSTIRQLICYSSTSYVHRIIFILLCLPRGNWIDAILLIPRAPHYHDPQHPGQFPITHPSWPGIRTQRIYKVHPLVRWLSAVVRRASFVSSVAVRRSSVVVRRPPNVKYRKHTIYIYIFVLIFYIYIYE